jgi:hypothetical protein
MWGRAARPDGFTADNVQWRPANDALATEKRETGAVAPETELAA